ncbi:hypothetical protein T01_3420 [Trichinella spiralis]|uniref:Uncharacterized protein n=1 Tax=Trichinella spiralis TaxID=6334 RepID=A0A0V1AL84_TRISP|nr:hypothetical protein T01_3420 [Trichinella spiralis]
MEKSNKGTSKLVIRKQNDREPRLFQYIHQCYFLVDSSVKEQFV